MDRRFLRKARTRAGLHLDELAAAAGLSFGRAYGIESGRLKLTAAAEAALRRGLARLIEQRQKVCGELLAQLNVNP